MVKLADELHLMRETMIKQQELTFDMRAASEAKFDSAFADRQRVIEAINSGASLPANQLEHLHKNISSEHWRLLHLSLMTGELKKEQENKLENELVWREKRVRLLEVAIKALVAHEDLVRIRGIRHDLNLKEPPPDQTTILVARGEAPNVRHHMFKLRKGVDDRQRTIKPYIPPYIRNLTDAYKPHLIYWEVRGFVVRPRPKQRVGAHRMHDILLTRSRPTCIR